MEKEILIMMATYNGEKYIREQLESIFAQTYTNFDLLISDDGSNDNTINIIHDYQSKYGNIILISNTQVHGALHNFSNLIKYSKQIQKYNYYMFSDQDDVWKKEKVDYSLKEISKFKTNKPILLYTSKQYVDQKLINMNWNIPNENIIDLSLLFQNRTFGCTYIFNNSLYDKLEWNISPSFINYDHYVAIQAFLFGSIYFYNYKTILYRQHGDNVSGAVRRSFFERINIRKKYAKVIDLFKFLLEYAMKNYAELNNIDKTKIEMMNNKKNRISIVSYCLKYHLYMNTLLGTIQFYIALLFSNIKNNK